MIDYFSRMSRGARQGPLWWRLSQHLPPRPLPRLEAGQLVSLLCRGCRMAFRWGCHAPDIDSFFIDDVVLRYFPFLGARLPASRQLGFLSLFLMSDSGHWLRARLFCLCWFAPGSLFITGIVVAERRGVTPHRAADAYKPVFGYAIYYMRIRHAPSKPWEVRDNAAPAREARREHSISTTASWPVLAWPGAYGQVLPPIMAFARHFQHASALL